MTYRSVLVKGIMGLPSETLVARVANNIDFWKEYEAKIVLVNGAKSNNPVLREELWIGKNLEVIEKYRSKRGGKSNTLEDLGMPWQGLYIGLSNTPSPIANEMIKNIEFYFDERMFGYEDFAKLLLTNSGGGLYYDSEGKRRK